MKHAIFSTMVLIALATTATAQPRQSSQAEQMNNAFTIDMYGRLAASKGNLFFSPTSIQTALAMTWAGARGQTADEMARALHLGGGQVNEELGGFLTKLNSDGQKDGYELAVANALWGAKNYPFLPDYLALVKKNYDGNLSDLDFLANSEGSRHTINDWVADKTHDRIKDLIPAGAINSTTRLVLTNAIYFNGKWDLPFKKAQTRDDEFTADTGKKLKTPFMNQLEHCRYTEDDKVQVLELTYGKNDLAMRIFLPKKADGLAAFEKELTVASLSALAGKLRQEEVRVSIPSFTMESQFELSNVLQAMGMKRAFGAQADFTGMSSAEQLSISAVIHKAFVKVDEQGTEAAAATGVVMRALAMPVRTEPKVFKADHPFMFQIVHQASGAVLFMGRLVTP